MCEWCVDSGINEATDLETGIEYFVRCFCKLGKDSMHKELPIWNSGLEQRFYRQKFTWARCQKWKPAESTSQVSAASIQDRVELWKFKMQVSKAHWQK